MRQLFAWLFAVWLTTAPAFAADNAVVVTPGAGVTMRSKDVGSLVQSMIEIPGDTAGNPLATAPGTPNASFALPVQGVTGGTAVPMSAAALPLPTGAATSALQTTINTTLGSPFQAGGSIGNASFAVTQATSSSLKGQVDPLTIGTWGIVVSTQNSATPTNGHLVEGQFNTSPTTISSGNVSPLQLDNAGNLLVNIKAGAGSGGTAIADNAAFTQGTTNETPIGCFYTAGTYTNITSTHVGIAQCNITGQLLVSVVNTNANGSAVSASSSPVVIASDQAAVAIKAASASIASGAVASGAFASGSIGSGAMVDLGAIADATATTGSTGSVSAKLRLMTTELNTINTTLGTPMQASGGSVTANAGTNLNTSLLALETGGNLATLAGGVSSSIFQSNTKQINGVAPLMGNGVTGTGSQRVTIASDNTAFSVNATLQASSATAIGTVNPTTIGNWGLAASTQNGTTPTNGQLVMGQFNTTPTTITTGGISPFQLDSAGNLLVNIKAGAGSGGTAIADNAAFTLGTTSETPIGCYNGTATTTAAHVGIVACTTAGSVHTTVDNTNANGSAVSASSSPVVIASDQAAVAIKAASASIASGAIASGAIASGAVSSGAFASGAIGTGAIASGAVASGAIASGAFAAGSFLNATAGDPCMFSPKTNLAISQNGTSSTQLVALSGSTTITVCSLSLVAAGATTVALTTGTGTACVTGNAAVLGTTTANIANSISLAANGGLTLGNGAGTIAAGAASSELCMILGTSVFVSGNLTYVQR